VSQLSVASEVAVMMFRLRNLCVFWRNVLLLSVCKSLLGMEVVVSSIILKKFAYYTTLNPRRWWIFLHWQHAYKHFHVCCVCKSVIVM